MRAEDSSKFNCKQQSKNKSAINRAAGERYSAVYASNPKAIEKSTETNDLIVYSSNENHIQTISRFLRS